MKEQLQTSIIGKVLIESEIYDVYLNKEGTSFFIDMQNGEYVIIDLPTVESVYESLEVSDKVLLATVSKSCFNKDEARGVILTSDATYYIYNNEDIMRYDLINSSEEKFNWDINTIISEEDMEQE